MLVNEKILVMGIFPFSRNAVESSFPGVCVGGGGERGRLNCGLFYVDSWLVISVYLSSLPVAHLSASPKRRLVVTGDSARIQDETTENSTWFFNLLGVQHRHTGPRVNVSSERLLLIF